MLLSNVIIYSNFSNIKYYKIHFYHQFINVLDWNEIFHTFRHFQYPGPADSHVEGGIYISPEFQLGQVYDGGLMDPGLDLTSDREPLILYRPVYLCIVRQNSGKSTSKSKVKQNSSDRLVESTKLIS